MVKDIPSDLRPKIRGKLRLHIGKAYYRTKRYLEWWFGKYKFSRTDPQASDTVFRYINATHRTPLIRNLKSADMQLQYNKVTNLKIAAKKLNHTIIHPGETFSLWKLVGKPTKRKGYLEGMILFYGSVKPGIGGGLCQISNMIYWMALHTPLTIIERYRHSFDVFPDSDRTQPFGSGATCIYNYRDLMITDETPQTFELCLEVTDKELIGYMRSDSSPSFKYEVYEKEHLINHEFWGGYSRHNTLYRKVYDVNGCIVADEYITENHALMMYQPFIEEKRDKV